jgi:beta-glucosidase
VRPEKELKAFAKVTLEPGEEKIVRFELSKRDFAYYDASLHDWAVNPGKFDVLVGGSSNALTLNQTIEVTSTETPNQRLTSNSLLKEFAIHPKGKEFYGELVSNCINQRKNASSLADGPPVWSTGKGLRSRSSLR